MAVPRMCALSEVVWSPPENKNWDDFADRMNHQYKRLNEKEVNYHVPIPEGGLNKVVFIQSAAVQLSSAAKDARIHYTLNGTEPTKESAVYEEPLVFTEDAVVNVCTILPHGKKSKIRKIILDKQMYKKTERVRGHIAGLKFEIFYGHFKKPEILEDKRPFKSGTVKKLQVPLEISGEFAVKFRGYIRIPENGIYTFHSIIDRMFIGNDLVLKNDDPVKERIRSGQIALCRGVHSVTVIFIKGLMKSDFSVEYEGPGIKRIEIPAPVLFHTK